MISLMVVEVRLHIEDRTVMYQVLQYSNFCLVAEKPLLQYSNRPKVIISFSMLMSLAQSWSWIRAWPQYML